MRGTGRLCLFYDGAMEDTAQAMTFITRASAIWEARGDASARAGGGALPVIMSIIRSSAKPTTTATITYNLIQKKRKVVAQRGSRVEVKPKHRGEKNSCRFVWVPGTALLVCLRFADDID